MYFYGKISCVKVGSKSTNQNHRFGDHSRVSIFAAACVIGPAWPAYSVTKSVGKFNSSLVVSIVFY